MKKQYTKPQIMFESFTLCTNIAANCEATASVVKANSADFHSCGMVIEGLGQAFTTGWGGCNIKITTPGAYNGYCYDVPSENYNMFNS